MLELRQIAFEYDDRLLFEKVSFSLAYKTLLHLKGKNGVGKTTLMRLIAGIIQPVEGDILFEGQSISKHLTAYQKQLCYVGHKQALRNELTVLENLTFDLQACAQNDLEKLLCQMNLSQLAHVPCAKLSAGQKKRSSLARIALSRKPVWLLDEPFVALDEESIALISQLMIEHCSSGGLIILTSHQSLPEAIPNCQEYRL